MVPLSLREKRTLGGMLEIRNILELYMKVLKMESLSKVILIMKMIHTAGRQ